MPAFLANIRFLLLIEWKNEGNRERKDAEPGWRRFFGGYHFNCQLFTPTNRNSSALKLHSIIFSQTDKTKILCNQLSNKKLLNKCASYPKQSELSRTFYCWSEDCAKLTRSGDFFQTTIKTYFSFFISDQALIDIQTAAIFVRLPNRWYHVKNLQIYNYYIGIIHDEKLFEPSKKNDKNLSFWNDF